jgi:hypothetical protein
LVVSVQEKEKQSSYIYIYASDCMCIKPVIIHKIAYAFWYRSLSLSKYYSLPVRIHNLLNHMLEGKYHYISWFIKRKWYIIFLYVRSIIHLRKSFPKRPIALFFTGFWKLLVRHIIQP